MSVLEAPSLTKRFDHLTAVDALTISVESGEVFGLLGPNGQARLPLDFGVLAMATTVMALMPDGCTSGSVGEAILGVNA